MSDAVSVSDGDTGTVGKGEVVVTLSPEAYAAAQRIAALKKIPVEEALSEALALQEAVAVEKSSGARLLIERHGQVEELVG